MGTRARKKGKSGNVKHGRIKNKPSHKRYNAENRRDKNKARRAAKIARKLERRNKKL